MPKILVVDDSQTLRAQLRKDLESRAFEVLEASDGLEGLNVLNSQGAVDLIVCDLNMPNMDGFTMCSKVREQDRFKNIPIFMLTTEASADMKAKAKEIGIRAWITKPYVADKLLAAVEKVTKG